MSRRWLSGLIRPGLLVLLVAVAGSGVPGSDGSARRWDAPEGLRTATVRRSPVESTVSMGGEVGSFKFTLMTCELEALSGGPSAMTILSLVPEGSSVKKGDVLCRLDSSDYEEKARLAEIDLERARAEKRQAELDLSAAQAALREYRDGQASVEDKNYRSQIKTAQADASRLKSRLGWAREMRDLGYLSRAEYAEEDRAALKAAIDLDRLTGQFENFRRFTVPKTILDLEGQVAGAEAKLRVATLALGNRERRLKHIRDLVDQCSIRAPHDGFVIYWDLNWGDMQPIREGSQVHQGQPLFTLPDLNNLCVQVSVHESVIDRVKVGMPATIKIDALPGRTFRGRVASISQLPEMNWRVGIDVRHFLAQIRLDEQPKGALPNMSASVRVVSTRRDNTLVVPPAAITFEERRAYCDVLGPDGPRHRAVELGLTSLDSVEVVRGLAEGEEVVLYEPDPTPAPSASHAFLPPFNDL